MPLEPTPVLDVVSRASSLLTDIIVSSSDTDCGCIQSSPDSVPCGSKMVEVSDEQYCKHVDGRR